MIVHKLLKSASWLKFTHGVQHQSSTRVISTSAITCGGFWEKDPKDGYSKEEMSLAKEIGFVRSGLKELKNEVKLLKEEIVEKFIDAPQVFIEPGSMDIKWKFDSPAMLDKWVTTADKDHNEGFSECSLIINENKKGLFHGFLRTELPKDGRIKSSGYCNVRSMRPRKSFKRETFHDWNMYTHLVLRVRGDGRSYVLNLATCGQWDIMWNDLYSFVLYTRGGPYWQRAKIPFSRFFLSSKGRVQDKQGPIALDRITSLGISCGDAIPGPFSLEIDYIGIEFDPSHTEEFAYEMYQVPRYIVGV